MKVLVIGCGGQLGAALETSTPGGLTVLGVDLPDVDITDAESLRKALTSFRPDVVINAAAYTAVDKAESEQELAFRVNASGPQVLARLCVELDSRLIHVSTDFVFRGDRSTPYRPDDETDPVNVYGASKRAGECNVVELMPATSVIVRTAWLYDHCGHNFLRSMLRLLDERDELGVVVDQVGTPTAAGSLAKALWAMVQIGSLSGIFHWTDAGVASWYDFASAIQEEGLAMGLLRRAIPLRPIMGKDYPTAARRPSYSVLDKSATWSALDIAPVHWRANLRAVMREAKVDA